MAHLPELNFPAFYNAETKLMKDGWRVVNPARFDAVFNVYNEGVEGRMLDAACEAERAAIPHLDAIYLLKGWQKSKGAQLELKVALEHNLEIVVQE
jgi:hypothetical protein